MKTTTDFEPMAHFFEINATREQVTEALLRVLGNINVEANTGLKNDRDMLLSFVGTLL